MSEQTWLTCQFCTQTKIIGKQSFMKELYPEIFSRSSKLKIQGKLSTSQKRSRGSKVNRNDKLLFTFLWSPLFFYSQHLISKGSVLMRIPRNERQIALKRALTPRNAPRTSDGSHKNFTAVIQLSWTEFKLRRNVFQLFSPIDVNYSQQGLTRASGKCTKVNYSEHFTINMHDWRHVH